MSFLLLLVSYSIIFYVQQRLVKETGWVVHSYTVISTAESLKAELTGAETGVRGYVITHDPRFLKPYNEAITKTPLLNAELRTLVADNIEQQKRADTLDRLIRKRMDILTNGLLDFQSNGYIITEEMKLKREASLNSMDSIWLYVSKFNATEQKLILDRKNRLSDFFRWAKVMAIISLVIMFIALLYSLITFNTEHAARQKADKRANKYLIDLESNLNELKKKDIELKELRDMEKFASTGRIARTIAHEVRNPLTNILLATEQLKETGNGTIESPVLLDLINRNADRINQLVSDLLNATRFTHLDFSKVDINQLLEETLEMARDRIELNRVKVKKNFSAGLNEVTLDKEKIKVALLNIIVNAIESMSKDEGVLLVNTRQQDNRCVIEIRDNGKGMDEETLQKMFDPYFTSKPNGNGLGLTNTQNIILNHNGKISAFSRPGDGTLFLITLDIERQFVLDKDKIWGNFST